VGVAVFFFLLWALLTHSHVNSWKDISHLAPAEALVERGTWAIEGTRLGDRTGDRVFLNEHFYSDKPPVLSLMAAGVYAVLHRGLRVSLDPRGCDPGASPCYCFAVMCPGEPDWSYYLLTFTLVGLPSALMLALFYWSITLRAVSTPLALLLTTVLGLGTPVFPYSLVFANHVPAAACLMVGLYALIRARVRGPASGRWLLIAGFATALAATLDLATGPFLVFFLGAAAHRHRRSAWWFLVGCVPPLGLLIALDWWSIGSPLPANLHAGGYAYPGSVFPASVAGNRSAANVLDYSFRMLLGDHGVLAFSPVLLWALFALWTVLRRRDHALWSEAMATGLACLTMTCYFILFTDNFGGVAYGQRWFTAMMPGLFFFAAQPSLYRSTARRLVFAGLAIVSIFSAWQGALDPWTSQRPLLRLETSATTVGRFVDRLPADAVIYATPPRIRQAPVFPQPAWLSRLREFDAASGALPVGDPTRPTIYVTKSKDQLAADLLQKTLPLGRWALMTEGFAVFRVERDTDRVPPNQPIRAVFGNEEDLGQIELLGYDLTLLPAGGKSVGPSDPLTVRLYWRSVAPVDLAYTAFVHLLGPANPSTGTPLWAQDDHQPGHATYPTDRWFPGEMVLDQFQLQIPSDAPAGTYTLTTGFYDLATLRRLARTDTAGDTATLGTVTLAP
jgi:hypothetical protein